MSILGNISKAFFWFSILLFTGGISIADQKIVHDTLPEIKGGWYTLDPYQYEVTEGGVKTLTGLDVELMKLISAKVNQKVGYDHVFWEDLLQDIKNGKRDFGTGALFTEERAQYAHYSVPYRYQDDSLFVLKNKTKQFKFSSVPELIALLKKKHLKLGVVKGYVYTDDNLNAYINDPKNQELIVKTHGDYESLNVLLEKDIDGFLSDRIVGATTVWRTANGEKVSEIRLNIKKPIHIIFSKKTVSPDLVEKYNQAINDIKNGDTYEKIISWYLEPVLFLQTEDSGLFRFTEVIGTIAFAISGLIIAFKERATLFGAFILAILPSLGGGLMRDVIVGQNPVRALQSPVYLSCVLLTVLIGFFSIKFLMHLKEKYEVPGDIVDIIQKQAKHILMVTDAIGLAMFTVTGVIVSLLVKADPLWLWGPFFAFLTGAGGGILRDMLSKARYIAALEGELYGEIALFWGLFLSLFILHSGVDVQPEQIQWAVIITIVGAFLTRIVAYFMNVQNTYFGKKN